jgi:hypothetical protein
MSSVDPKGGLFPDFDPLIRKANEALDQARPLIDQAQSIVQDLRRWGLAVKGTLRSPMGEFSVDVRLQIPQGPA